MRGEGRGSALGPANSQVLAVQLVGRPPEPPAAHMRPDGESTSNPSDNTQETGMERKRTFSACFCQGCFIVLNTKIYFQTAHRRSAGQGEARQVWVPRCLGDWTPPTAAAGKEDPCPVAQPKLQASAAALQPQARPGPGTRRLRTPKGAAGGGSQNSTRGTAAPDTGNSAQPAGAGSSENHLLWETPRGSGLSSRFPFAFQKVQKQKQRKKHTFGAKVSSHTREPHQGPAALTEPAP